MIKYLDLKRINDQHDAEIRQASYVTGLSPDT